MCAQWQINGQHRTCSKRRGSFGPGVRVNGSAACGGRRAIEVHSCSGACTLDGLIGAGIRSWRCSRSAEFLNAKVVSVGHVEESTSGVGRNIVWTSELSIAAACTSAHFDERSRGGKELNSVITSVSDINCSGIIDGNAFGSAELTIAGPVCAPLGNERARAIEFLNSIVPAIGYVEVVS